MNTLVQKTQVIENWYRESEEFSTLVNYRILRAGHIRTHANYHIQRQSVVGHELIFCLKGKGVIQFNNKTYPVKKGDLAWLPVRLPHGHYPDSTEPWEILWLRIESSKMNNIMQILNVFSEPVFEFNEPEEVTDIYYQLFALMKSHSLVSDAHCDALCSQLIYLLLRNRSQQTDDSLLITHRGLGHLIYHIHSHYNDEWDIEKFMQYCQVSKSQLFRLFQETFDQSPLKWLKNYRLSQARRMLVETEDTIGKIAGLVGYNDPLHFSRDFHRGVGLSPREFRRREKQNSTGIPE